MKSKEIIHELKHHSPFTLSATLIATILVIFIFKIFPNLTQLNEPLFESLHILHLFASAIVSSAIYYKCDSNFLKAGFVGIISALVIGSLSDVLFPYLGGILLGLKTSFHLPLIEKPILILTTVILGSFIGIKTKITKLPHFTHVFLSVFASLFYLLSFSSSSNFIFLILTFFIVFIAVLIPCCLSDIVFPYFFLGEKIKHCGCN